MAEEKTYVFGDGNGSVPAWLPFMNNGNGGLFGGNGWGGGILGFFLGLLFGNGGWGNGFGFGGNGAAGAGYLANQLNNNNNTDLLMNAINGTDSDVRLLATTLNADVNEVRSAIASLNTAVTSVGSQVGMSSLQVINAIQAGNSTLASQLAQCCCENRLLTTQQGYESRIQNMQQTETLGSKIDANGRAITDAIAAQSTMITKEFCDVKERELQAKIDTQAGIITQLRGQIDNANQTAQVAAMLAPINAKLAEIESKQPNTVPVQYPNLVAVNATPYVSGGYYPQYPQYGYGNGGNLIF